MSASLNSSLSQLLRRISSKDCADAQVALSELRLLIKSEIDICSVNGRVPPQHSRLVEPGERLLSDQEVDRGLELKSALLEAERCLQCKNAPCRTGRKVKESLQGGCPVGLRIPEFIDALKQGDIRRSYQILMEDNPLHPITARVCPQDEQCQAACALHSKGAVSIGQLERAVGDLYKELYGADSDLTLSIDKARDFPIALIGSGPASLTAAIFLARKGYRNICIFEAFHESAGVLRYGIPSFRLPRHVIDDVIGYVKALGVRFLTDVVIGRTLTIQDLRRMGFRAFFLGTGAGLPIFLNISGEELNGVISANEFLTRCNLMSAGSFDFDTPVHVGRKVVVVGGGNVAMDAARWARRLTAQEFGADKSEVILLYRRAREDMPARREEILHAEEEGIKFVFLASPEKFAESDKKGWVGKIICRQMRLSDQKDKDGRSRIEPVDGDEGLFTIEGVETVIEALGTRPNGLLVKQNQGLDAKSDKVVIRNEATGETSLEGVFAGGDVSRGGATVILAMGDGKRAASGIAGYLDRLSEDASQLSVHSKLKDIDDWFSIKDIKVVGLGVTRDGKAYQTKAIEVYAPLIAESAKAGQFVMVMPQKKGERIALTLADWNAENGTIVLVFQEIGVSTYKLGRMKVGDRLFSILGPLGQPSGVHPLAEGKSVVFVGGGVGIAPVYPIARAHHEIGNRVISIVGARDEKLLFWTEKMRAVSDELSTTLDSKGEFVTHALLRLLSDDTARRNIDHIVAIGPVVMMENVYKTVDSFCREKSELPIKVVVSLNPTMMDGTGMCGGCRLLVKGASQYGCVDGPEFEASLVDFDSLKRRQSMYHLHEKKAFDAHWENHLCAEKTLS